MSQKTSNNKTSNIATNAFTIGFLILFFLSPIIFNFLAYQFYLGNGQLFPASTSAAVLITCYSVILAITALIAVNIIRSRRSARPLTRPITPGSSPKTQTMEIAEKTRLIICGKAGGMAQDYKIREKIFCDHFARQNVARYPRGTNTTTVAVPENMFPKIDDRTAQQAILDEVLGQLGVNSKASKITWTAEKYTDAGEWIVFAVRGIS